MERNLDLAASRNGDLILIALDLDDGCAANEATVARARIEEWRNGRNIRVEVVFFTREFESIFLSCAHEIFRENGADIIENAEAIRGAKERVRDIIGRRYRETQDQNEFTKKLNLNTLYLRNRSFRRLCRAVTGKEYEEISVEFRE